MFSFSFLCFLFIIRFFSPPSPLETPDTQAPLTMSRHTHRIPTPYHVPLGGQESKCYVDFSQEK